MNGSAWNGWRFQRRQAAAKAAVAASMASMIRGIAPRNATLAAGAAGKRHTPVPASLGFSMNASQCTAREMLPRISRAEDTKFSRMVEAPLLLSDSLCRTSTHAHAPASSANSVPPFARLHSTQAEVQSSKPATQRPQRRLSEDCRRSPTHCRLPQNEGGQV